jgi:hypothetical protein
MSSTLSQRLHRWLAGDADEAMLRWTFRGLLTVTVAVLAADLAELNGWFATAEASPPPAELRQDGPTSDTPSAMPALLAPLLKRLMPLPPPDPVLVQPITFELTGGGRLMATGTITAGSAQAFAAEIDKRGDYVKTVVLNSPGGSVADALAMGRLIRSRKFATEVDAGKYCASSCPLVFAGGVERRAGERAAIGVHQIAAVKSASNAPPRDEMSVAQNISARCQRYLLDMGINLQVWVHAMETPHDQLFIFRPDELKALNLVTSASNSPPEKPRT